MATRPSFTTTSGASLQPFEASIGTKERKVGAAWLIVAIAERPSDITITRSTSDPAANMVM